MIHEEEGVQIWPKEGGIFPRILIVFESEALPPFCKSIVNKIEKSLTMGPRHTGIPGYWVAFLLLGHADELAKTNALRLRIAERQMQILHFPGAGFANFSRISGDYRASTLLVPLKAKHP